MMNQSKIFYRLLVFWFIPLVLVSCTAIPFIQPVPTSTLVIKSKIENTEIIRSGMPTFAKPGPYTVGMTDLNIQKNDYEVRTFIWYPVQSNGKPNIQGGPFPLLVFASGWATPPQGGYGDLLNHIASYGFVATTWYPRSEFDYQSPLNKWYAPLAYRPLDYKLIVDYLETMTARGGPLEGMIDMKRIAIAGHSMGGATALEESGAQIDFGWCSAHKDLVSKDLEGTCQQFVNYQQETANNLGLKTIPTGKWPQISDPRIVAMVAMAPIGKLWGADYESVATVKVPALVMVGSNDNVLLPELAAYPVYEHLGSPKKTLVVFEDKDHLLFWGPGYTTGTVEDLDRIKHIMVAFLLTEVKGDANAAEALSPANMQMPGVKIETTEFNNK